MEEQQQVPDLQVTIGCNGGNVHLLLTAPCGEHEKIMSARTAREMGKALIRMADDANDQLPSLDARPKDRQPYLVPLAIVAIALLLIRR